LEPENITDLYCRDELPNNNRRTIYFKITKSNLKKKLFAKTSSIGYGRSKSKNHISNLIIRVGKNQLILMGLLLIGLILLGQEFIIL
jgi:hypothetical protein